MPHAIRDVGNLVTTSTSATVTTALGHLEDASAITIFLASSAGALTSGHVVQISQFDPADVFPLVGVTQSSNFFTVTSSLSYTSGGTITFNNIAFRGIRLAILGSANTSGEPIAFVTKQITAALAGLSILGASVANLLSACGPFAI